MSTTGQRLGRVLLLSTEWTTACTRSGLAFSCHGYGRHPWGACVHELGCLQALLGQWCTVTHSCLHQEASTCAGKAFLAFMQPNHGPQVNIVMTCRLLWYDASRPSGLRRAAPFQSSAIIALAGLRGSTCADRGGGPCHKRTRMHTFRHTYAPTYTSTHINTHTHTRMWHTCTHARAHTTHAHTHFGFPLLVCLSADLNPASYDSYPLWALQRALVGLADAREDRCEHARDLS